MRKKVKEIKGQKEKLSADCRQKALLFSEMLIKSINFCVF